MEQENTAKPGLAAGEETAEPETAAGSIDDMDTAQFREYINGLKESGQPESGDNAGSADGGGDADDDDDHSEDEEPEDDAHAEEDSPEAEAQSAEDERKEARSASGSDAGKEKKNTEKTFTQTDVDKIVRSRLEERNRADREALGTLDELGAEAMRFYGGGRDEAIRKMIADLRGQNAQQMGVSEENYTQMRQTEDKARRYDEMQKTEQNRRAEIDAIQRRWREQSEEMKDIVPDFDFAEAMKDEDFKEAVLNGKSVQTAYMLSQRQRGGPAKKQPEAAKTRRNIKQNAAARKQTAGKAEFDPERASSKEFRDYIRRIQRGE